MCAGITTFNSLRHSGAGPGDLVGVQGIGGLGHLGVQFAAKFGYRVAAIGRGPENGTLAKKLGASIYIDTNAANAAEELKKLGGAKVILATAPNAKAMAALVGGLGVGGKLLVVGATLRADGDFGTFADTGGTSKDGPVERQWIRKTRCNFPRCQVCGQ